MPVLIGLGSDVPAWPWAGRSGSLDREVPWHETELHDRLAPVLGQNVINLIGPAPVECHPPAIQLVVEVGRAPGRGAQAVAARERIVVPHGERAAEDPVEGFVQRTTARSVGPVYLIIADAPPDRPERP
jgi:hypothetical protein